MKNITKKVIPLCKGKIYILTFYRKLKWAISWLNSSVFNNLTSVSSRSKSKGKKCKEKCWHKNKIGHLRKDC